MSKVFIYSTDIYDRKKFISLLETYGYDITIDDTNVCMVLDLYKKKLYTDNRLEYGKYVLGEYYSEIPGDWDSTIRIDIIKDMHMEGKISKERLVYRLPSDIDIIGEMVKYYYTKRKIFVFEDLNIEIL